MIGIVLAALLWGTTGTAASLLPASVSPLATGAATMCVGGLLLALTAPRQAAAVLRGGGASWRWIVPGALAVVAYPLAFYSSMSLAGVAVGNVVSLGTAPLFAALLERLLDPAARRRRLDRRWAASAGAAVAGVALLAASGTTSSPATTASSPVPVRPRPPACRPTSTFLAGVALGLLAGLAYATYTYTAGRLLDLGHTARGSMAAQFGVGAVVLVPVLLLTGGADRRDGQLGRRAPLPRARADVRRVPAVRGGPPHRVQLAGDDGHAARARRRDAARGAGGGGAARPRPAWLGLALVLAGVAAVVTSRPTPRPTAARRRADAPRRAVGSDA